MKTCKCGRTIPVRHNSTIQPKKCPVCINNERMEAKSKQPQWVKPSAKTIAMNKADNWFSLYIRTKYSYEGICLCYTCMEPMLIKTAQCGHYIKRRHTGLRYDENNARPQCAKCNDEANNGMQKEFGILLAKEIGVESFDQLRQMVLFTESATIAYYNEMAKKYKMMYLNLLKNT